MRVYLKPMVLRKYLQEKNMSQNWLAQRLGVTSGYMSQLMRRQRCPSPALRRKIEEMFLDSRFEDLFETEE